MNNPRFTLEGGAALEALLQKLTTDVGATLQPLLPPNCWRSLLLIGGYGRGEGGVETLDNGSQRPHNNLDFLLVTHGLSRQASIALKSTLDAALLDLSQRSAVGLDLGMIDEAKLRRSPCLVMWYDARFGHKTVLGDATLFSSLTRFTPQAIPAWDIRNLLVNRGTLLVINDLLLERGVLTETERRTVIKHAIKGVIGCGDALLYAEGNYHWSYAEKRRRMESSQLASPRFKELYAEAIAFRFAPSYEPFVDRDLKLWQDDLRHQINRVHLQFERHRLRQPQLRWEGYIEASLSAALRPQREELLRQGARLLRSRLRLAPRSLSLSAALGLRMGGAREVLSVTFPTVAYKLPERRERRLTVSLLGGADLSLSALRRAYLRAWRAHGDINFATVVQKLGLSLEEAS